MKKNQVHIIVISHYSHYSQIVITTITPLHFFYSNKNLEFSWNSISRIWNCDKKYLYGYQDYLYFLISK